MLSSLLDVTAWVQVLGYVGITAVIFAESGLFFGFFLPGDSLVFVAGMLASQGVFHIGWLILMLVTAAIAGYLLAYWFGRYLGEWLLKRPDSFWFKRRYLEKARLFYDRHGGKALVLARLIPIVRTFVPIVAGMARMSYVHYVWYTVLGAVIWCMGIPLLGYYLGSRIPGIADWILPIILLIVVLSVLPGVYHYIKQRRARS